MLSMIKGMLPRPLKREVRRLVQNAWESPAYRITRRRPTDGTVRHVVFVCKGNICRSAFAEYYFRSVVPEGTLRIESCGIDVNQGDFSPPEAVKVSREFRIDLSGHHSKGIAACDLQNADLIVPMEYGQYLRLTTLRPESKGKVSLLRDFAPWPERTLCNIYDPYGLGESEFRRCFLILQRALDGLKDHLLAARGEA